MRVLVCGGRDYSDQAHVDKVLNTIGGIRHLFHGNARGVDTLAGNWGNRQDGVSVHPVPAEWKKYGRKAGPIRNRKMLGQLPDLVVAFPGGRGTANMVKQAKAAGVEVIEISE